MSPTPVVHVTQVTQVTQVTHVTHARYAGHWCTQNNKAIHIVDTYLFQTLVDYTDHTSIPYTLREIYMKSFCKPGKSSPFLPDDFLSAQRIVLIPVNLPINFHWMILAVKAALVKFPTIKYKVSLTAYNSDDSYQAEDIALLHACANIVEQMLEGRKIPIEREYELRLGYAPVQRLEHNECALHCIGHMSLISHGAELQYCIDTT